MVFGNMGKESGTEFVSQRPFGRKKHFFGEFLMNAQGEDVVAGIRVPGPINEVSKMKGTKFYPPKLNAKSI